MCGRYYIDNAEADEMFAAFLWEAEARAERAAWMLSCRGEIFPTNLAPVIAPGAVHRKIGAYPMRWGFSHPTRGLQVINTRSETAMEKPLFRESASKRRCLIPATGYFEWKREPDGKKTKFAFQSPAGGTLYLAGLYLKFAEGQPPCFSILTRDAADAVKDIHGRMPVLLPKERISDWLSPENAFPDMLACAVTDVCAARA